MRALEVEHLYPKNVHIVNSSRLNSLLTQLSQSHCIQPHFNRILKVCYQQLFSQVLDQELDQKQVTVKTRMADQHPESRLSSLVIDKDQKAVVVDIARAGMLPSQILFDDLCEIIEPENVRMDHVFASRAVDGNQKVTHTELNSSKIGGDINDATVFFPDPMGATGNSLCQVIETYKNQVDGSQKKWIAIHLIVTPEYIRKVTKTHPDVVIYTARLDRGLSDAKIQDSKPGTHWDQERGLNEIQYIVPGAGGVGEIINNSYV